SALPSGQIAAARSRRTSSRQETTQVSKKHNTTRNAARTTVAGIGASAGGIEALRELFGTVPPDLDLAYVVVVHLAPQHESELTAILARCTTMPVVEVVDRRHFDLTP